MTKISTRLWCQDIIALLAIISLFFAIGLGNRPLNAPDEARYCEIPREMVATHNYLTPRLNGIKYFEKPPLFYWVQCVAVKSGHLNEWVMRTPTLIFAVLGCLMVYTLGYALYNRPTGL